MSLKKAFGTNKQSIEEGVWVELCENEDGTTCRLRIKRMGQQTPEFMKQIANHRKAFSADHFSAAKIDQQQASMIRVIAKTIIVGWENVEDWRVSEETDSFPGSETSRPKYMEYTSENAEIMLIEFPDLLELITEQATDLETFQDKDIEIKN
jgi:hypothetical protein